MTEPLKRVPITAAPPRLHRGLPLLMSVATGRSVAGNYFTQPLPEVIGRELGLSATTVSFVYL